MWRIAACDPPSPFFYAQRDLVLWLVATEEGCWVIRLGMCCYEVAKMVHVRIKDKHHVPETCVGRRERIH